MFTDTDPVLVFIQPDHIHPNPYQPRQAMEPTKLQELADSLVTTNGFVQKPAARPAVGKDDDHVELIYGHRRCAAWPLAFPGQPIPVLLYTNVTDREMSDAALAENTYDSLNAIEVAQVIERRVREFKITQVEAAAPFGIRTQGAASNKVKLLKLPPVIQSELIKGNLPERVARQLVGIANLFPKETVAAIQAAEAAHPSAKADTILANVANLLDKKGVDLGLAPFALDWPAAPIPLAQPVGDLTATPACLGCPNLFAHHHDSFCLLADCFNAKIHAWLGVLSQRLHIPVLEATDKPASIYQTAYLHEAVGKSLVAAHKKNPALQLRLVYNPKENHWLSRALTGHSRVHVVTLDPAAVEKFIAALPKPDAAGSRRAKSQPAPADSPAAQEARRAERGEKRRFKQDVAWLIPHASQLLGQQLGLSGAALVYLCQAYFTPDRYHFILREFPGLEEWFIDLEARATKAPPKDADSLWRTFFAAYSIIQSSHLSSQNSYNKLVDDLHELATAAPAYSDEGGFGLKLPSHWADPPIHRTNSNCWVCGVFSSNPEITKIEMSLGWQVLTQGKATLAITCPDCKGQSPSAAAPAKDPKPAKSTTKKGKK